MCSYPMVNKIAIEKVTRGTETSKYPEEEKETSIFLVAASERERGQTEVLAFRGCGSQYGIRTDSRTVLEKQSAEGETPVDEIQIEPSDTRVVPDT